MRMNNRIKEQYAQIASALQLRFDEEYEAIHGNYGGYPVLIVPSSSGSNVYYYMPKICIAAESALGPLSKEDCKAYKKEHAYVSSLSQSGRLVTLVVKNQRKAERLMEAIGTELRNLISYLHSRGFQPCCQVCGQPVPAEAYFVSGGFLQMCEDCRVSLNQRMAVQMNRDRSKSENVIGGVVGAALGSLLGAASIILLSQLGYVAALSGLVMAICTLKGYELLSGKLSRLGIVVSCVLMVAMTYVGDRIDWALVVARDVGMGFASAFGYIPTLVNIGMIEASTYWANLLLVYLFVILGAVPTILGVLRNRRDEGKISRLS